MTCRIKKDIGDHFFDSFVRVEDSYFYRHTSVIYGRCQLHCMGDRTAMVLAVLRYSLLVVPVASSGQIVF